MSDPTPPIREDGLCVQCEGERKMPASRLHRASARLDPFCSATCARAFYGVSLPTDVHAPGVRHREPQSPQYIRSKRYADRRATT